MGNLQAGSEGHPGIVYVSGGRDLADAARLGLEQELEHFRPLIEAALAYSQDTCSWSDVVTEVMEGRAFLMIHPSRKSVCVVQPVHDLHFFTASGDMNDVMEMEEEAERKAKASGFDRMTLAGRKGWQRVLKSRGWKPEAGLVKDL